jgi:hypothetical protein
MDKIRSHRDLKVWNKAMDAGMKYEEIISMLATMANQPQKWRL